MRKVFLLLFCAAIAGLTLFLLLGHRDQQTVDLGSRADLALQEVQYVETERGRTKWKLRAKRVEHWIRGEVTKAYELEVVFFLEDGRVVKVRAQKGAFKHGDFIELEGGVVLQTEEGYLLRTEALRYEDRERLVRTEAPVQIEGEGVVLKGVGLEVKLKEQSFLIPKEVEATIEVG